MKYYIRGKLFSTMNLICKRWVCLVMLLLIIANTWLFYVYFVAHMEEAKSVDPMFRMEESYGITTEENDTDIHSVIRKEKFQMTSMNNGVVSNNIHEAYRRYIKHFYSDYLYENIMAMKPITFDPLYKNPCWNGTSDNGPITDGKLHCLPYFYIIGVKKSGTSDLFSRIVNHPEVVTGASMEAWFPRIRWNTVTGFNRGKVPKILNSDVDHRTVGFYVRQFDPTSRIIHSHQSDASTTTKYNLITVDATPANLFVHGKWTYLPGNEGLVEPRFTNFNYINHLNPNAKIVIIIRDPVTRQYSDFLHITSKYDTTSMKAEIFHDQVTQLTNAYKDCFSRWSMRRCIYNETLRHDFMKRGILLADSFTCGFVAFYMKEMIEVFGRDRIHTVLTMEHEHDMENSLSKTFKFLNLSPLGHSKLEAIVKKGRTNAKDKKRNEVGPMFNHTRDMLYNFYEPYNKDMADLMNDNRYLFRKIAQ